MARSATIVQVFVSSPSDLGPERELLESLAQELNRTWSKTLGVVFELVRWESNVRPAAGGDPQTLINAQIPNDYDVFIGMLWGRFGTPTPRAMSGTLEEFNHAMERRERETTTPEVMVYFKDAPLPPSKIDPSQLKLVQEFRASLADRGVLYSTFETETDFQNSIRAHLSSLAQKFASPVSFDSRRNATQVQKPDQSTDEQVDDLGYLDYLEVYEVRMAEMTSTLESISTATQRIGEQMAGRAREITALDESQKNSKDARRVIKLGADDMIAYAAIVRRQLPLFSDSRDDALNALTSALVLYEDFSETDEDQLKGLRGSLAELQLAASGSKEGLLGFRSSIEGFPRLTSELNRAKKAVLGQLDNLLADVDRTVSIIQNILESIDRMLGR